MLFICQTNWLGQKANRQPSVIIRSLHQSAPKVPLSVVEKSSTQVFHSKTKKSLSNLVRKCSQEIHDIPKIARQHRTNCSALGDQVPTHIVPALNPKDTQNALPVRACRFESDKGHHEKAGAAKKQKFLCSPFFILRKPARPERKSQEQGLSLPRSGDCQT